MRIVDLGTSGELYATGGASWDDLGLTKDWRTVVERLAPDSKPHDIQEKAIRDCHLLSSRRNVVVSSPTNSGKSLIGYLAILSGIREGRRALLIEPFRALAQEKYDELKERLLELGDAIPRIPNIEITTGDYRLDGETLLAPPPKGGEIIIATPERIDAIMRNPDFDGWVSSFGIVCVDEAHLLGDQKRGPALETVITRFLCAKAPPRFVLLSATLGGCDLVKEWLDPCDVVISTVRRPPLHQNVIELEGEEKTDDVVLSLVTDALAETGSSVMVFVYRTGDTAVLARRINERVGSAVAGAYNSRMPAAAKAQTRLDYELGNIRCLVSTTALGAGVNLPATHAIVRDLTFLPDGPVPLRDIMQMMGRAGRGERQGRAWAIVKPGDKWREQDLASQIRVPRLPELQSSLMVDHANRGAQRQIHDSKIISIAQMVLGQLVRRERQSGEDLRMFFKRSLGGKAVVDQVGRAIRWLDDSQRKLAHVEENGDVLATTLGKAVARGSLPLEVGAGIGNLVRDVLSCDDEDGLVSGWSPLDTLIVLELLNPRERGLRKFSRELVDQVDGWIELSVVKSALFSGWIRGTFEASRAEEVFGSLGIHLDGNGSKGETAWKQGYLATMRSIVLLQLGEGARTEDVTRRWRVSGLDGVEERWRDHVLWQIGGIAELFEVPCFYHHLKEELNAGQERIFRVKKCFAKIRGGTYDLLGSLRFCSPLGPLFRDLEQAKAGVGLRTKEKLEGLGLSTMMEIRQLSDNVLIAAGIRKGIVKKLRSYITRRLQ